MNLRKRKYVFGRSKLREQVKKKELPKVEVEVKTTEEKSEEI